jgi:hypothetical protein
VSGVGTFVSAVDGLADPAATNTAPAAIAAAAVNAIACFLLITWISFRICTPLQLRAC